MSIFKDIEKLASLKIQLHSGVGDSRQQNLEIMRIVIKYRRIPFLGHAVRSIANAQAY